MFHRFKTVGGLALCLSILTSRVLLGADTNGGPDLDEVAGRGLEYLAAQQSPDGAFTDKGPRVAMTGLGLLAFLSAGDGPQLGKYGATVRAAIDFLVQQAPPDGYFGKVDGSGMYGQAVTTLALAEAWGVEETDARRGRIKEVVERAARVILNAQNASKPPLFDGGWQNDPRGADSNLAISGWNVIALRACAKCGMDLPHDALSRAIAFMLKCHRPDGGFANQPGDGDSSINVTGTAVLCLYLMDSSATAQQADGIAFLRAHTVDDRTPVYYGAMYGSMWAVQLAGEPALSAISAPVFKLLTKLQQTDGSWPASRSNEEPGVTYATAMAVLMLEASNRLLPVYQR
jgi:hypothetical protein